MSGDGSSGASPSSAASSAAANPSTGGSSSSSSSASASEGAAAGAAGGVGSEDACRDYQSSLEDLTFNSKPHINMLTILAEENVPFAKDIVSLIEAQTAKAPSNEKLPVMYLMDSIVKNVGREYLAAFTKNLVATFVNVFEKVDENTRKSLFKLRSTWDEIFPLKKLYALDVRVNSIDPAWPIKPLPPNVNTSSIHVNPKFLNKSPEEPPAPSTAVSSPPVSCSTVSSTPIVPEMQKNLTQEQLIRQQLLAKQKQLLELQQKKLELELEQTKAQLAVSLSVQQSGPGVGQGSLKQHVPQPSQMPIKAPNQVGLPPEKKRLSPPQDIKIPSRDPRLNRTGPHSSHSKDPSHRNKDFIMNPVSQSDPKPSKTLQAERQNASKQEKQKQNEKSQKKELDQFDSKTKSPSPLQNRPLHAKDPRNQECENTRVSEMSKRDPRLKKHLVEKPDGRDEDIKEKRRSMEKKEEHRSIGGRGKMINGVVQKHELCAEETEKPGGKPGRSSIRKRSRSPRSRSPSSHSPKRRERRSPKRRLRSLSPAGSKTGKPRQSGPKQSHAEDFGPGIRDERPSNKRSLKQEGRDSRRLKKIHEDRLQEGTNQHSSKAASEPKENVENWQGSKSSKRWKSGWEENKNPQLAEEHQGLCKSPHQRHREPWASSKGVPSLRTPKQQHRLSVDANLQIPKELTLANKRELLKKANERLSSGEITQDDFLVLCHKIHQLFQYQEGKHRYNVRDSPTGEKGISKKKPLLSESDLIYHEHKAKLKRTQVQHSFPRLNMADAEEMLDYHLKDTFLSGMDCEQTKSKGGNQFGERSRRHSPVGSRPYAENAAHDGRRRHDESVSSKGIREEPRLPFSEHYKRPRYEDTEKPFTESSGSRFGVNEGNQRFSSLMEDRPHFEGSPRHPGTRTGGDGQGTLFEGPAPTNSRIEGPQPNLRFEGSLSQPLSKYDGPPGKSGGKSSLMFDGPPAQMGSGPLRFDGPSEVGNAIRFEGPIGQPGGVIRFDGPTGQPMGGIRFESLHGQPKGGMRFEGPHGQPASGIRFEAPHGQSSGGVRFEGPHDQPSTGGMRFDGQPSGGMRFEVPHGQLSSGIRFEGPHDRPVGPHGPPGGGMRFEGPHGQPMGPGAGLRFEGPHMQPMGPLGQPGGNLRFEAPHGQPMGPHGQPAGGLRFEGPHGQPGIAPRFDGPHGQPGIGPRFEGPTVQSGGGLRFEGPISQAGPRFDGCPSRFDGQPGQPSLLQRLDGLHVQPGPRFEMGPAQQAPRFDGPSGQQVHSRFDTPISQRFEDQAARFDLPLGHQGQRMENIPNHPASRLETPPYGQTGPYNEPPNQPAYNGPSQGMPFQRPEQIFENPQGPNFNGLPVPGAQVFPNALNRAPGPFYEDKNLQGPQYGNFNSITVGNIQPSQQVSVMSVAAVQPVPYSQGQPLLPVQAHNPGSFVPGQPGNIPLSYPDNHLGQLDVNELYSKLLSTGILKVLQADSTSAQVNEVSTKPAPEEEEEEEEDQDQNEDQDVPDLTNFVIEELKQRYDSVINRLYTGIQCYSCGMRFTTSQTDVYADHLDWHYRQNRTEKDVSRKVTHRRWYYSLTDWIEFEEIADLEERAKSQFFEKVHEEVVLKTQEAAKEKEFQSVPAGPAGVDESCEICQEQFEQYWDEEEEEWHLKNAIRVDEKIYHPSCYEDYQKTSSFDSTPSPSKTPVENPLNIMLNIVKQEVQDSCDSPKVEEKPDECMEESTPAPVEIKMEPEKVESV